MIANCPECGKLVEAVEFTAEQKREEEYMLTRRTRLFDCKCGRSWYGSKIYPRGNVKER